MQRALIVEDEFILGMLAQELLEREGFAVVGNVPTGEEAVELARAERPDVVFLDLKLQGTADGVDTALRIRQFSRAPIFFVTGNSDKVARARMAAVENSSLLVKPIQREALADMLRSLKAGPAASGSPAGFERYPRS